MASILRDFARRSTNSKSGDESKGSEDLRTSTSDSTQSLDPSKTLRPILPRKPAASDKSFIKVGGPGFSTLLPSPQSCGTSLPKYLDKSTASQVSPDQSSRDVYTAKKDLAGFSEFGSQSSHDSTASSHPRFSNMMNLGRKVMRSLSRKMSRPPPEMASAAVQLSDKEVTTKPAVSSKRVPTTILMPKNPVTPNFRKTPITDATADVDRGEAEASARPTTPMANQKTFCEAACSHAVLLNARQKALSKLEASVRGLEVSKEHEEVIDIMVDAAVRSAWDATLEMQADFLREVTALRDRIRRVEGDSKKLIDSIPKGVDLFKELPKGDSRIEYYDAMKYLSKPLQELVMEITNEKIKMLFDKDPDCRQRMNENNLEFFDKYLQDMRSVKYEQALQENKELKEKLVNLERANERMQQDCEHYQGRLSDSSQSGRDHDREKTRRMSQQIEYEQKNTKQLASTLLETTSREKAALEKIEKLELKIADYEERLGKRRKSVSSEIEKPERKRQNS